MHGKSGGVLILAKREHGTPDFSGPGFLVAKKKMMGHGQAEEESCSVCDAKMDGEDEEGIGEPMTTDTDTDESYESKVAKMRGMAQEMMKISDDLAKASEMHAGQSEKLRKLSEDHAEAEG